MFKAGWETILNPKSKQSKGDIEGIDEGKGDSLREDIIRELYFSSFLSCFKTIDQKGEQRIKNEMEKTSLFCFACNIKNQLLWFTSFFKQWTYGFVLLSVEGFWVEIVHSILLYKWHCNII